MKNPLKLSGCCVRPSAPKKSRKRKAQMGSETEPKMKPWKEKKLPQCSMCSNAAPMSCERCKCSFYCSLECQNADWRTHKVICKEWLNFETSGFATPPNPSSRRGIFFPAGTDTPKFVWVTTTWIPARDENTPGLEKIDFKPYVGEDAVNCIQISANAIRSRRRNDDRIRLFYRPDAILDGSSRNRTTARLTYGNAAYFPWCGSLLAMKNRIPSEFDPGIKYTHMDPGDFRDLVDLFCSYKSRHYMNEMHLSPNHKGPDSPLTKDRLAIGASQGEDPPENPANRLYSRMKAQKRNIPSVPGVRINCLRDMFARGKDMYEAVEVPVDDQIFGENVQPTIVSQLIGYPIRTRRVRPISENDEANLPATFLHMYPYLLRQDWGQAFPQHWQGHAGSVLVVHATPNQIKTNPYAVKELCAFCMDFLKPCIELYLEDPENTQLREDIVRIVVSPRMFQRFRDEYKSGRVFRGATDWPGVGNSTPELPTMIFPTIAVRRYFSGSDEQEHEHEQEQEQN